MIRLLERIVNLPTPIAELKASVVAEVEVAVTISVEGPHAHSP